MKKILLTAFSFFLATNALAKTTVTSYYARETKGKNGAVFMRIETTNPDSLLAAHSTVAKKVEIHTHIHEGHVMRMRPVSKIALRAGHCTELKPGGYHIMLLGLDKPLVAGKKFNLDLYFARAGKVSIQVPVHQLGHHESCH